MEIKVKATIKIPKLSTDEILDFDIKEINSVNYKNLTLINPSDKPLLA